MADQDKIKEQSGLNIEDLEKENLRLRNEVLEQELKYTKYKSYAPAIVSIGFLLAVVILSANAIPRYYELEQEKLELARYQFEMQSEQINNSLRLQEANETMRLLEILMNSRLVETAANELLRVPKELSDEAKDLAIELIRTLKINVNCTPRWICYNKDPKSAETPENPSVTEFTPQNMPTNTFWVRNNNRENICFACRYANLDTWRTLDSYNNPRGAIWPGGRITDE